VGDIFYDIIAAAKQRWQNRLGDSIPVNLAFMDERYNKDSVNETATVLPEALISILDKSIDANRLHAIP
jgi:hypothetical protein